MMVVGREVSRSDKKISALFADKSLAVNTASWRPYFQDSIPELTSVFVISLPKVRHYFVCSQKRIL